MTCMSDRPHRYKQTAAIGRAYSSYYTTEGAANTQAAYPGMRVVVSIKPHCLCTDKTRQGNCFIYRYL